MADGACRRSARLGALNGGTTKGVACKGHTQSRGCPAAECGQRDAAMAQMPQQILSSFHSSWPARLTAATGGSPISGPLACLQMPQPAKAVGFSSREW